MAVVADIAYPYQDGFNIDAYTDGGGELLIMKASEGGGYRNPKFAQWRDQAHARGLLVWPYHFLRANTTDSEVGNFLRATGGLRDGEVAVCDWEDSADGNQAADWCGRIEAETGRRPVLYSYAPWLNGHDTSRLTRYPLWIAAYGANDGQEHALPGTDRWAPFQDGPGSYPHEGRTVGWQFTSRGSGRVAGFDGSDLDVSRFDMSRADLARMGGSVPPPDPDPNRYGGRLVMRVG